MGKCSIVLSAVDLRITWLISQQVISWIFTFQLNDVMLSSRRQHVSNGAFGKMPLSNRDILKTIDPAAIVHHRARVTVNIKTERFVDKQQLALLPSSAASNTYLPCP